MMSLQAELNRNQVIYLTIAEYSGKDLKKPFLVSEAYKLVGEKLKELNASQSKIQKKTFMSDVNEMLQNTQKDPNKLTLHLARKYGQKMKDVTGKTLITANNFDDSNLYLSTEKLG